MKKLCLNLFVFIFCLSLFSFGAGKLSSEFKGDENFYFKSAGEMLESGDLVTPRYMGSERFQKPPLFYWLVLLSFKTFGVSWFSARLPSMAFGALCALLIFAISNLFFEDRRIGVFAALFLATTPIFYRYARLAVPDMTLLFFMTLALYCFARRYKGGAGRLNGVVFFAALAFAFLVKGPVGALIPLLVAGAFCVAQRKKIPFAAADILTGAIVFLVIAVPWFYFMYRAHGDMYFSHAWGREVLQRLGGGYSGSPAMQYLKGVSFYAGALITKFFPYSLFLPLAFINASRLKGAGEGKDARRFFILWIVIVFLLFSFVAEKRTHYLLALSPALSIFIAADLKGILKSRIAPLGIVLFLAIAYIAISVSPPLGLFKNKMERAASAIKAQFKTGDRIGIGSHGIIPEELQAYFEVPVDNVKVRYKSDGTADLDTAGPLLDFLNSGGRVFCVVKRMDYDLCVPEEIRNKLHVLDRYYVWKRRIKFNKSLKASIVSAKPGGFREIFQNEILVISNRK